MKKVLIFLLTVIAAFTFSACEDRSNSGDGANDEVPAVINYEVSEMYADKDGANIYGKLYVPDLEGKLPVVILSHSSSLTADSMNSYCIGFAQRGYVAYAFDFCGGSSDSRSDGEQSDMTIFTEVDDLKAVIETVKTLEFADSDKIYLFGTSQGGLVSALTANDLTDDIEGLILLYPAFNTAELAQKFGAIAGIFGGFGGTGNAFISTLQDYDVYEHIAEFKGRVLIIHGSNDFIVNPSYSEQAQELYEDCELYIIQGANHGFNSENMSMNGDYDEEVWQYIDAFLAE